MTSIRVGLVVLLLLGPWVLMSGACGASPGSSVTDNDCAMCHDGSDKDIPAVSATALTGSPHEGFACLDCHADIRGVPHADSPAKVACSNCHSEEAKTYTRHGRGVVGVTPDIPGCASCHGTHAIRSPGDPVSSVHPDHLPATCGTCHQNLDLVKKHEIERSQPVEMYEASVHGVARKAGNTKAAVCSDCHGLEGNAHQILPRSDPLSSLFHFNIPKTCGRCHGAVEKEYWEGIHGKLTLRGDTHTPVCSDCHGEHGILHPSDPRANVNPVHVAQATCVPCHESARINEVYGRTAGKLVSFVDSFHGLKSQSGDLTVANCASCHGAHKVLPSTDPASSINPANIARTCGSCHPGISTQLAQTTRIHATDEDRAAGWPGFFTRIYIALILAVIGGMVVYVLLDYRRGMKELRRRPQIRRMSENAVLQHTVLFASFTVLVLSGFALRYSQEAFFRFLFGWDGGFQVRGIIHRVAACVFLCGVIWHAVYLARPEGRKFLAGMRPGLRDARELRQAVLYNLERSHEHPHLGRFSFVEKAEYWALVWGTAIMAGTGLLLWFDNFTVRTFSTVFHDVVRVIHLYEAWLATLAILVWHLYSVIFKPAVYPGNPAWLDGMMPRDMYAKEHPGDHEALTGSDR